MRFRFGTVLGTAVLALAGGFGMATAASASPPPPRGYLQTANGNYVAIQGAVRAGAGLHEVSKTASAAKWALQGNNVELLGNSDGLCMTIAGGQVVLGQCDNKRAAAKVIPAAGGMVKLYFVQAGLYVTWQGSGSITASASGAGSHANFIPPS